MKFTFTVASTGKKYTAEKVLGGFNVKWEDDFGRQFVSPYSNEDAERYINKGMWADFKQENYKNNTFTIKQGQIEAAARFVVANNKYMHYHTVDSMSVKIKSYIKDMIDKINSGKESYYCSTAGFTISIGLEDENYYVVEVLVSPDVSVDEEFVNVEEII